VLIPSLYTISPRTRSLRPVRVPSNQNIRWRLSFPPSTDKRKGILISPYFSYLPDRYLDEVQYLSRRHIRATHFIVIYVDFNVFSSFFFSLIILFHLIFVSNLILIFLFLFSYLFLDLFFFNFIP